MALKERRQGVANCNHIWASVFTPDWEVECTECNRLVFNVLPHDEAVEICNKI